MIKTYAASKGLAKPVVKRIGRRIRKTNRVWRTMMNRCSRNGQLFGIWLSSIQASLFLSGCIVLIASYQLIAFTSKQLFVRSLIWIRTIKRLCNIYTEFELKRLSKENIFRIFSLSRHIYVHGQHIIVVIFSSVRDKFKIREYFHFLSLSLFLVRLRKAKKTV